MATKSFVRVLWGVSSYQMSEEFKKNLTQLIVSGLPDSVTDEDKIKLAGRDIAWINMSDRLSKVKDNIVRSMGEKIKYPFVCYTFGEDNHNHLKNLGIESVLLNKHPNPFHMYRHKIEAWIYAMKDFDEIVFMDWDNRPIKLVDDKFWELLRTKDEFQASLGRYKTARLKHRDPIDGNNYNPSGSFVYMRNKSLPVQIAEIWKNSPNMWSEEPSLGILTDRIMGKWDIQEYGKRFEPIVYKKDKSNIFPKDDRLVYFRNRCHPHKY